MDVLDKYLVENLKEESNMSKSFSRRIDKANSSSGVKKVLADIKKAVNTGSIDAKELVKLVDKADTKLGEF